MNRSPVRFLAGVVAVVLAAAGCGSTAGLTPVTYPDPSVSCPGALRSWKLEVLDRRARREGSEGVQALLTNSIRQSFPGCQWDGAGDAGRVQIEVHRFAAVQDGNSWEAAADWSVVVNDPSGRTLTEFEASEEVSRPNYRGSNNEKEALREAFDRAMRKTLAGLRSVTSVAELRPPVRTGVVRAEAARTGGLFVSSTFFGTSEIGSAVLLSTGLERFSQPRRSEVL
jgi:hypothetical protein